MEERREKRGKGKGGRGKEKRGWEGGRREEKMKIYFQKTIFFTLFDFHFSSSPPQRPGVPLTNSISFHPPLLSLGVRTPVLNTYPLEQQRCNDGLVRMPPFT